MGVFRSWIRLSIPYLWILWSVETSFGTSKAVDDLSYALPIPQIV